VAVVFSPVPFFPSSDPVSDLGGGDDSGVISFRFYVVPSLLRFLIVFSCSCHCSGLCFGHSFRFRPWRRGWVLFLTLFPALASAPFPTLEETTWIFDSTMSVGTIGCCFCVLVQVLGGNRGGGLLCFCGGLSGGVIARVWVLVMVTWCFRVFSSLELVVFMGDSIECRWCRGGLWWGRSVV